MSDSKSYHDMQWAIYKARILKLLKNNRADLRNTTGALPPEQLPIGGPAGAGYPPEAHAIGGALHTGSLTAALHGNLPGGALHATVIAAGAAGFMSGADKTKLDGIASGATANTGTVTSVALTDNQRHTGAITGDTAGESGLCWPDNRSSRRADVSQSGGE
jgi:hypothetical protein